MTCESCFHKEVCHERNKSFSNDYFDSHIEHIRACSSYVNEKLVNILPCPEGTPIYRIDFEWRCDTQHCPYEGWRDCADCGNGKNKSKIVETTYNAGIKFGFRYHKTKEEAEEYLKNCSDEDIKDYASMC